MRALFAHSKTRLALLCSLTLGAPWTACARPPTQTLTERIAGVPRVRHFASATAYEAFLRAEILANRGQYADAARQLELATFADETDGWLLARRAEMLLRAGDTQDALEGAQDCVRRFPAQAACWLVQGEVLQRLARTAEASESFTRALAVASEDPEVRAAVAIAQGSDRVTAARALEDAPLARPGDRTLAQRALLDYARDTRPTLAVTRRTRAHDALVRGAFSQADSLLTPLLLTQRATLEDRLALISARVGDGRPADAIALVAGLELGHAQAGVSRTELAQRWLDVAQPARALELARESLAEGHDDGRTLRVLGESLIESDSRAVSEGLLALARVRVDDGEFVSAQTVAARALVRRAQPAWAAQVLTQAIARLSGDAHRAVDRDRLRVALASQHWAAGQRVQAQTLLAIVETPIGRQQRGILLASHDPPATVLRDLRERSGVLADDALADAIVVLVCLARDGHCEQAELTRRLAGALRGAQESAMTLRARALSSQDSHEREALLRHAWTRDPLSPWAAILQTFRG
ncbi:MAG: hypothetical protein Q8Q09_07310 [Deltaproteobacteria bacterium]|nr:hypothetical protein [Deltaproteobacteria bacterium]